MSLFGTIQLANNTLTAAQIGLQVAGNNIANANTPGYLRQQVLFTPALTQQIGDLPLGLGVHVAGIVQQVDHYLEDRLRTAVSDLAHSEAQEEAHLKLESLLGELNDTDLSTSLTNFFNSIQDILNQPESESVRNLAVLKGQTLATDIQRLYQRANGIRDDVNQRIIGAAGDINRLLTEVAKLNVQIVRVEGGSTSHSDAVGLRDQRGQALGQLAKLMDIRVAEQRSGAVSVFAGGDILVFDGEHREVGVTYDTSRGLTVADLKVQQTDAPLPASAGQVAGWIASRDQVLGGFLDDLNQFAQTLMFEFNRVFSSGQGLNGYQALTGEFAAADPAAALDAAGLPFAPVNGSFQILVKNTMTGITSTTDVLVKLNGLEDDTSLQQLVTQLDDISGIQATLDSAGRLSLRADSPQLQFGFAHDTSGVLAALGVNTFFSGGTAVNIGVREEIAQDPAKFAASRGGLGADSDNAALLADLFDQPLNSANGDSLAVIYDRFTAQVTQGSGVSRAVAEGFRVFHRTLSAEQLAISGVSIDDEAVRMITFQRTYQAAAKLISTLNGLLETLIEL